MQIEKAAGALGAFVSGICLGDTLTAQALHDIRKALLEHEVLFFRDQTLSALEFSSLARKFGDIEDHPAYTTVPDAPDVQILESTPQQPTKIEKWHSDMTFRAIPPGLTFLHAQVVPAFGGDTLWASASAAYKALSAPFKTLLTGLTAQHDFRHGFRESLAEPGGEERLGDMIAANPVVTHPVVRVHPESGRRALFVNDLFTVCINAMSERESRALLALLCRQAVAEEFTVRLRWQPGTLAIWDNRVTQHKPINDYFPQHRLMYRLTLAGETVQGEPLHTEYGGSA